MRVLHGVTAGGDNDVLPLPVDPEQRDRPPRPCDEAPRIRESAGTLAERARAEGWSHEQYLARVLEEEVREGDAPRIGQAVDAFMLLLAEPWPSADGWHRQRSSRCQGRAAESVPATGPQNDVVTTRRRVHSNAT